MPENFSPAESRLLLDELGTHIPGLLYQTSGPPDGSDLRVPYIGGRCFEFTGWHPHEIYERPARLIEAIHPEDLPRYLERARESMAALAPFLIELRTVSRLSGEVRWLRVSSRVRSLTNGDLLYNGVAVDITDRVLATRELERANAEMERRVAERTAELHRSNRDLQQEIASRVQAEERVMELQELLAHSSRLSVMSEMAAGFAHEIHQPLAVITNYANGSIRRLANGGVDSASLADKLRHVVAEALRAGEIVQRIRDFLQRRETERRRLDVNEAVRNAIALSSFCTRRHSVSIESRLDENLPPVVADSIQLTQAVLNLLVNGIEAVSALAESARRVDVVTRRAEEDAVEITVVDSGPGIPSELADRVFDPFFTTKPRGLGMGLAMTRTIAETLGGRLQLDAATVPGTCFRLSLPAATVNSPLVAGAARDRG